MPHVHSEQLTIEQAINDAAADQSQTREIERANSWLRPLVLQFCISRDQMYFHLNELETWVASHLQRIGQPAPASGSAGRILRLLAAEGEVTYKVANRRQSLYVITAIRQGGAAIQ